MHSSKFEIQPHRRQFLISSQEKPFLEHWISYQLSNGQFLSHCPELKVNKDEEIMFIGDFISPKKLSISSKSTQTIANKTKECSGRWAIISNGNILCDAGALMGIYYSKDSNLISSNPKIIQEINRAPLRTRRKLGWYGMNWFPAPLTPITGVKKLLRDQSLNLKDFTIAHCKRQNEKEFTNLDKKKIAEEVNSRITETLIELSNHGKLTLALTAGIDSRVLLSALLKAKIDFSTYTLEHPLISEADKKIPKQLAEDFGFKHSYIKLKPKQQKLARIFKQHIGGFSEDADKFFIERGMFDELGSDTILIRGGGWEIGRKFYHSKLKTLSWKECKEDPKILVKKFFLFGSLTSSSEEIAEWTNWRDTHQNEYDWKDTFYLDQRIGSWLSTVELALDLIPSKSMHPFSSATLFDLALAAQNESTGKEYLWNQIIMMNEKKLLVTPINPNWDIKNKKRLQTLKRYCQAFYNELAQLF